MCESESSSKGTHYGVATNSRLLKIIGLFCKRALQKRRYPAKETYNIWNAYPPISRIWSSMSHTWMGRVTHENESCLTNECVMPQTWMREYSSKRTRYHPQEKLRMSRMGWAQMPWALVSPPRTVFVYFIYLWYIHMCIHIYIYRLIRRLPLHEYVYLYVCVCVVWDWRKCHGHWYPNYVWYLNIVFVVYAIRVSVYTYTYIYAYLYIYV